MLHWFAYILWDLQEGKGFVLTGLWEQQQSPEAHWWPLPPKSNHLWIWGNSRGKFEEFDPGLWGDIAFRTAEWTVGRPDEHTADSICICGRDPVGADTLACGTDVTLTHDQRSIDKLLLCLSRTNMWLKHRKNTLLLKRKRVSIKGRHYCFWGF